MDRQAGWVVADLTGLRASGGVPLFEWSAWSAAGSRAGRADSRERALEEAQAAYADLLAAERRATLRLVS